MTNHLTPALLSALADGELSAEQFSFVKEHLDRCSLCTSNALIQVLLKIAVATSGQRYTIPSHVQERMKQSAAK